MDVRPGGALVPAHAFARGGGVHQAWHLPRDRGARLVFTYVNEDADGTLGPETVVTVTFEDVGARTRLTLHHPDSATIPSRDAHEGGWTSALERFTEYLEQA